MNISAFFAASRMLKDPIQPQMNTDKHFIPNLRSSAFIGGEKFFRNLLVLGTTFVSARS
jgi:hypothetical protein